jgi:CBS domain-containing protein
MPNRPVREIIERDRLVKVAPDSTVKAAVGEMAEHCCGSIVVMEGEAVVGIFTERDLMLRVVHEGRDPLTTLMAEVMTKTPDTIGADAPVADAIRAMDEFSYRYLPVLDAGRCIGVISTRHLPFKDIIEMNEELQTRHDIAERMR